METFDLKRGLLLGSTVGGLCSDGAFEGHPWEEWCQRSRPRDAEPFRLADHWDKWRSDDALMHSMGLECCRFVLDWAHIQPEQDVFDDAAIAHAREEIIFLRAMGVRVTLVLHEFSEPAWFARLGGWGKQDNIRFFLQYAEKIVRTVGHLVEDYVPVGQPNLFAWCSCYCGAFPPGKKSAMLTRQVLSALAAAHIRSYTLIHALRRELGLRDTRVGASIYMRMLRPKNKKSPLNLVGTMDKLFQTTLGEAMTCGRFSAPLQNILHVKKGVYCDFHDLCCYALPDSVEGIPGAGREPGADELLYCAAVRSAMLRKPIFITEGPGISAPSPERVYEIVRAVSGAGLPVERLCTTAFADGFSPFPGGVQLGIVAVDPESGARKIRPAGEFLTRLIRNRGVTEEMCRDYASAEK